MFRELTVTHSSMLLRDFGDPLCRRQVDRTNCRKDSRGGSVNTHINRRKFDFVRRSFTPFRDITRMRA